MKIYFASAEVAPFAKVGGLADVAGSLPIALQHLGAETEVLMPLYSTIDRNKFGIEKTGKVLTVDIGDGTQTVELYASKLPESEVVVTFFAHEKWIGNGGVYADSPIDDLAGIEPNLPRFALFSAAVAHYVNEHAKPGDILHAHDWHTGLATALLHGAFDTPGLTTLHTIHNLAYQGGYGVEVAQSILGEKLLKELPRNAVFQGSGSDWLNFLVAGILTADWVSTVSPTYRNEILTKEYGEGVETFLQGREDRLVGIVNGIDTIRWNPKTDPSLEKTYTAKDVVEMKQKNKELLQEELGLPRGNNVFMLGMVSRIAEQKGFDILDPALPKILQDIENVQFVILGTGDPQYTADIKDVEARFPTSMVFVDRFDEDLAHRIYAASDAFYMPSRFEPCGLGQLFAMRYGTLPIARATGGLKDTVISGETGFVFDAYTADGVTNATKEAETLFANDKKAWDTMVQNAMARDSSWDASAVKYIQLYKKMRS